MAQMVDVFGELLVPQYSDDPLELRRIASCFRWDRHLPLASIGGVRRPKSAPNDSFRPNPHRGAASTRVFDANERFSKA
ncbi:hypothetical protein [Lysobacter sp. A3-1-A15]|uniref:hypothetical protein n=1 Tax=Novilysobacter viscosus TaxID=3098602 RepID=UPI002ED9AE78